MRHKQKFILLIVLMTLLSVLFMTISSGGNWEYTLPRRGRSLVAMILTGSAIAYSTVIFQSITNNKILTPSIIGLDSLYMLVQTFMIFTFGSMSLFMTHAAMNFGLSAGIMVLFSFVFYRILFSGERSQLYFLLLIGLVLGTFFSSLSTFMQVIIDPNEFMAIQGQMFASFNNVNRDLLGLASILFVLLLLPIRIEMRTLDVLLLGRDHAVNLGVSYTRVVKRLLILVAVLISLATALVGPITFLGLLVANVTYQMFKTYEHRILLPASMLTGMISLVLGQLVVQHVFTFETTLSVIINFIGGIYFLYLLLKERS
ncbi:iron chelate uptake ABC transporter family permease subunit [Salisediminibacterium beveridgei]|uniref:Iron compound ABC uptake transporter permease protein n=1 Tax=Salisediminibacterium beveridgei TaxID=632773 RepID=A0A1D7QXK9_9BACI|nr:iron chelate uptake ABC transporter family permease subunit [Salisediminibacterium beveridgei]AOM83739.1 Iron compound ABC uptake transporter permease protein [Salisediminibacterium beveridgei]